MRIKQDPWQAVADNMAELRDRNVTSNTALEKVIGDSNKYNPPRSLPIHLQTPQGRQAYIKSLFSHLSFIEAIGYRPDQRSSNDLLLVSAAVALLYTPDNYLEKMVA